METAECWMRREAGPSRKARDPCGLDQPDKEVAAPTDWVRVKVIKHELWVG